MQIGVNVERRVARMDAAKANRLRIVDTLPDLAEQGDMVLMKGQLHAYAEDRWHNIDDAVMSQVQSLAERLTALEDNGDE